MLVTCFDSLILIMTTRITKLTRDKNNNIIIITIPILLLFVQTEKENLESRSSLIICAFKAKSLMRGTTMTLEICCLVLIQKNYIGSEGSFSCLVYKLLVMMLMQRDKKLICTIKLYDFSGKWI